MRQFGLVFLVAAALATGASSAVAAPARAPASLPLEVRKAVVSYNTMCRESGGTPGRSPQLVKAVDLTGDGLVDYVIDVAFYDCGGAASALGAGQSGNDVTIYVGGPGGAARMTWSAAVYGARVEGQGPTARLWVDVAGLDCGQRNAGRVAMADLKSCSRALVWNPARQIFTYAPLKEARF